MKQQEQKSNNELLSEFACACNDARVGLRTVKLLYGGISRSSVERAVVAGEIPAPEKRTGNTNTWNVGELRANLRKEAA